jgi:hypothetical protein
MFKGVFIRYLGQLRDTLKVANRNSELVQQLDRVIRTSTASLLKNSIGNDGCFTVAWEEGEKDRNTTFNTQTSGLAALTATLTR